jgi:hypothetical protein
MVVVRKRGMEKVTPIRARTRQLAITVALGKLLTQSMVVDWWSTRRMMLSAGEKRGATVGMDISFKFIRLLIVF